MADDRRLLPESVGALAGLALRLYRRRFPLYFGLAFAGLVVQAVLAWLRPGDDGVYWAGQIVADGLITALVTIGVVADVRGGERRASGAIAADAVARWGVVTAVTALVEYVVISTSAGVFGSAEETGYGFLIPAIVVFWGSIAFASVIAAIDDKTASGFLVFASVGRSMSLAFARQNICRLIVVAAVAMIPMLVEILLQDLLFPRHVAGWLFISTIPVDALATGPLQAVFTIFYLDFIRRTPTAAR